MKIGLGVRFGFRLLFVCAGFQVFFLWLLFDVALFLLNFRCLLELLRRRTGHNGWVLGTIVLNLAQGNGLEGGFVISACAAAHRRL